MSQSTISPAGLWARAGAVIYDPFLALAERRGMADRRRALLAHASGDVLEIGAGTGLNLRHYPRAVTRLILTEPEPGMRRRLERRAARIRPASEVVAAGAEALPLADASVDCVVSTMVLCTVPDPAAALAEIRRVLRPGGRLLFVEHLRSDQPRLARRQDRWRRAWEAVGSGCRCNQDTLGLLAQAGLGVDDVDRGEWRGMPSLVRPLATGVAR